MKKTAFAKKVISLLLVLSIFFSFTGCSKSDETLTTDHLETSTGAGTETSGMTDQEEVFVRPENYATALLVTINPQLCLYLDAAGMVLAVEAANKDAEQIVGIISFENDGYEAAIEKIVTKSQEAGYLKGDAVIRVEITESKDPTVDTADILNKATITVSQTAAKLELKVEIETEDKSVVDAQPNVDAGEPTEEPTAPSAPTTPPANAPEQCSHTYKAATCTAPKTCSKCGVTEGNALGHNWSDATCTAPKTCKTCKATEGSASGHNYKDATCTAPKTCTKCGVTEDKALGHNWSDATCTAPKTCKTCKATEGSASGHNYKAATCTTPKTCSKCSATEGTAAGHSWKDATCTDPKTCTKCGTTEGTVLEHTYQNGVCTCGTRQLGVGIWQAYKLVGDVLEIIVVNSDGGIGEYVYLDIESEDTETIQQMIQGGCPSITYQGKTYLQWGGAGDPMYYEDIGENSITIHIGSPSDNYPDKFTLQRKSKDQLVVTAVVGCDWPGITAGMIFTYIG